MTWWGRRSQWSGFCPRCDSESCLDIRKTNGRWTLRELFTSYWEDSDFDVVCGSCGSAWPAPVHVSPISLAVRLDGDAAERSL